VILLLGELIPVTPAGILVHLSLELERVSLLIGHEFVEVAESVEEDPCYSLVVPKFGHGEVAVLLRTQHVAHLTDDVVEEHHFMVELLQSLQLLRVEELHFFGSYDAVAVKIHYFEPISQRSDCSFVFFVHHKVDEIVLAHLIA